MDILALQRFIIVKTVIDSVSKHPSIEIEIKSTPHEPFRFTRHQSRFKVQSKDIYVSGPDHRAHMFLV